MPRTLSSVIRAALNLTCSSRSRRRKPVTRSSANPAEVLETRQVLSAVSLGVIDGTTFKLDTNAAGDSSAAANSTEIDLIFGQPGDLILTGDWNGQGSTAVAVRQPGQNGAPNDGLIHWYFDTDGDAGFELERVFGLAGDQPVVGDWDGDGKDNIGVTRRSGGVGVANDGLLNWFLSTSNSPNDFIHRKYGFSSDTPVVGNWDGVRGDDLGIVRKDAANNLLWMQDWTGDAYPERIVRFGIAGDKPVTGDWDGNGTDNFGVTRAIGGTSLNWLLDTNNDSAVDVNRTLSSTGLTPVVGKWKFAEVSMEGVESGQSASQLIGIVSVGQTVRRRFIVKNTGNAPLLISGQKAPAGFQIVEGLPATLAPGGIAYFTLEFRPTQEGVVSGNAQFYTNDGNELLFSFPVHGATPAPEISVGLSANGQFQSLTDGQSPIVNFDTIHEGGAGQIRTFRISNDGQLPLVISGVRLPSGFVQVDPLSTTTVAPGSFTDLRVQLVTATIGTKQGQIEILSNDGNESPFNFTVRGIVNPREPEISVTESGLDIADGRTTPVNFGTVVRGAAAVTRTFEIVNSGTGNLTVSAIVISGSGFTVERQPVSLVAPGGRTTFAIRMETSVDNLLSATVRFSTNDTSESAYDFPISGTVQVPVATIVVDGLGASDFGRAEVGSVGPDRTFIIRNTGNIPLTLGAVQVPAGFAIVTAPASTVAPGSFTTLTIRMLTSTGGSVEGIVRFATNDATKNPFQFTVRGQVTFAEIEVRIKGAIVAEGQPGQLFMGASFAQQEYRFVEIFNRGTAPLVLSAPQISGGYSVIGQTPWGRAIAPGGSATIQVAFSSTTLGQKVGQMQFNTNDRTGNESTVSVNLRGKVFAPPIRNVINNNEYNSSVLTFWGDYVSIEIEPANGNNVGMGTQYYVISTSRSGVVLRQPCSGLLSAIRVIGSSSVSYVDWTERITLL
jgi:hypothetical protein